MRTFISINPSYGYLGLALVRNLYVNFFNPILELLLSCLFQIIVWGGHIFLTARSVFVFYCLLDLTCLPLHVALPALLKTFNFLHSDIIIGKLALYSLSSFQELNFLKNGVLHGWSAPCCHSLMLFNIFIWAFIIRIVLSKNWYFGVLSGPFCKEFAVCFIIVPSSELWYASGSWTKWDGCTLT